MYVDEIKHGSAREREEEKNGKCIVDVNLSIVVKRHHKNHI